MRPECQQGSLILGQVFIGTNSNLLVPIGTLIFKKSITLTKDTYHFCPLMNMFENL